MKNKFTAKVYINNDEMIESSGDNLEQLTDWVYSQAESTFGEVKAEIIDNKNHKVVKNIEYNTQDK